MKLNRPNIMHVLLVLSIVLALTLPVNVALARDSITEGLHTVSGLDGNEEKVCQVTLITGDTVTVATDADGERRYTISPAKPDRLGQHFLTIEQEGDTYIIPDGTDLDKLDMELFNIDYLVDEQYYEQSGLPLLISYLPRLSMAEVQSLENQIGKLGSDTKLYKEVSTISSQLAYRDIAVSYNNLMSRPEIQKVWLDKKVHAQLIDSVPLIGATSWWEAGYDGSGVEIAILDTGIDRTHPALDDLDDDPGTTDPKVVVNVNFSDDASFEDLDGHGTHVAGTAAGTYAGSTYQGVAPGARLWNVKVLNQYGKGYESWVLNGINFAALGPDGMAGTGDEADVISMSLGSSYVSDGTDPVSQAVNLAAEMGVIVTVAAGNSGPYPYSISVPGVAEKIITVGASDKDDKLASFSSRGPVIDARIKPDILAPGVDITSSVPGETYSPKSGTSMATPHVAGAAALLLEASGGEAPAGLSLSQFIKDALMCSAKDLGYTVYEQGGGRLDMNNCWGNDYSRDINDTSYVLVTPASLSLGEFSSGDTTTSGNLTFLTGSDAHDIALTAELIDAFSGVDYSGHVTINPTSFTIPAEGEVDVRLDVDLNSLPASVYSGKITATIDGDSQRTINAIFGFTKILHVNIHKTDISGNPAQEHPVWIINDAPSPDVSLIGYTDESGNLSFSATTSKFHLLSYGTDEANQVSIWTIAENVAVSGDTSVELDERDTRVIDFDPNKPGQIPAAKEAELYYLPDYWGARWSSSWWYPASFIARISPASRFLAGFNYQYYPEADFLPDNPELVNTGEWHNLVYPMVVLNDNTSLQTRLLAVMNPEINSIADLNKGRIYTYHGEGLDWLQTALSVYGITCNIYKTYPDEYLYLLERGYAVLVPIHPYPYLEDYIAEGTVRLLPWSPEAVSAVVNAYPQEVIATELPPDTYEGQAESLPGYAPKYQSPAADYDKLVHRRTSYSTALADERAYWDQYVYDYLGGGWSGFTYQMDAPQERWEWLYPDSIWYYTDYYKAEPYREWHFYSLSVTYAPGEHSWGIGGHPLTSGVEIYIGPAPTPIPVPPPAPPPEPVPSEPEPVPPEPAPPTTSYGLHIYGSISEDTYNNDLDFYKSEYTGNLMVTRNGEVVVDEVIWDYVSETVEFEDTANFTVEIRGRTPLALSGESYTRLDLTADYDRDSRPPELLFQVPGIDLYGVVPNGEVMVRVKVTESSLIENVDLWYSTDDHDNWIYAEAPVNDSGGWYKFNLGELQNTFVSLRVEAEDEYGNRIQYETCRSFCVGGEGVEVSINAPDKVPPDNDFAATVNITEVVDLNAAQYDIRFDPSVLRLDGIDNGQIGSTAVEAFPNEIEEGHWRIVQYPIPITASLNGPGYLAVLNFHTIGALGTSSNITITDGVLVGKEDEIPATWIGDKVEVSFNNFTCGDVNNDGKTNMADVMILFYDIADYPSAGAWTISNEWAADVNCDGKINMADLMILWYDIADYPSAGVWEINCCE